MTEPRLLQLFRLANATLYSLLIPPEATAALEGDETTRVAAANEFLVELQSRNVRRKILSLQQRYRDQQHQEQQQTSIGHEGISNRNSRRRRKPGEVNHEASGVSSETGVQIEMGSSWLAFLAVLCQMQPDGSSFITFPPERLFAAQSVLQRARRNKLVDAVDLEVESESQWLDESTALGMYRDTQFVTPMLHAYQQCMTVWNPFVADVLHHCYFQNRRNTETREEDDEEQVKGEIMLLTLASCSYITACQPAETAQRTAILEALGSAIATISLRIRYLKNSHNNQPPPSSPLAAGSTPSSDTAQNLSSSDHSSLVWMISEAFHHVFDRAQAFHLDPLALSTSLTLTLGALPDTILSSPGGARGRLSVDPRSLEAAVTELRGRGFHDLWTALQHVGSLLSLNNSNNNHTAHPFLVLTTLEKWARFLCVPQEKVNEISSLLSQFLSSNEPKDHAAALLFLTSVFEGGRWTEEQVLSFGLGLSGHQLVLGKKKQSSRSRRRHKEMVSNKTSNNNVEQAQREVVERGAVACQVAVAIWSPLNTLFRSVLDATLEPGEVDGEGPIGCVATATHTCLPFLLLLKQQEMPRGHELFQQLAHALVQLCSSSNQTVRSLALPPVYALYRAAVSKCREQQEQSASNSHQDDFVLDILPQCLTKLAAACFYPTDYFVDLRAESDEELEIHRNEVRDLFRALTGGEDEEGHEVPLPSLQLLHRTTKSLWQEMQKTQHHPPETYVHTLSALAKPLGRLVRQWLSTGRTEPQDSRLFVLQESSEQCLVQVLEILATSLLRISTLFHDSPNMQVVLPLSRTLNIAVASMAPVLGALASSSVTQSSVAKVLPLATRLALLSLRFLPELATSEKLVYEIRGTMRGPGGEDHVGSLSLMRLTTENEALTSLLVQSVAPDMKDICATHEYLKSVEQCWDESSQNPRTVPKSRRNLLGVICRLEVSSRGQAGASEMLTSLVHSSVSLILSVDTNRLSEQSFFMLCETCHDLAALAPLFAPSFFDQGENKKSLETLRLAAVQQYMTLIHDLEIDGTIQQWNRLRGALFCLFVTSGNSDWGETTAVVARDLILAECQSVSQFFQTGGSQTSAVFEDSVISPDVVPAGLFVMSIGQRFINQPSTEPLPTPHCINVLLDVSSTVIESLLLPMPATTEGTFCDPRCSIAEAWFATLAGLARSRQVVSSKNDPVRLNQLLTDSVVAAVALIFSPRLGKDEIGSNGDALGGMSMDGPQSLAMMDFLSAFLALGSDSLARSVEELGKRFPSHVHGQPITDGTLGLAVLLSALFRAIQGALPPWVVESVPLVFSNLFCCGLGRNLTVFGNVMRASIELRVPVSFPSPMRGVQPGQLLSGYAFDGIQESTKLTFVQQVLELAEADNHTSWKRLKHCIKAACGGKKKDTDFRQKPSLTRWEFERI